MEDKPQQQVIGRSVKGQWTKGHSGNPGGRKKGTKTMKQWVREKLEAMTDEERDNFLEGLPKDIIWKMSEGNAENKTDVTSGGKPIPILGLHVQDNNIHNQDSEAQ